MSASDVGYVHVLTPIGPMIERAAEGLLVTDERLIRLGEAVAAMKHQVGAMNPNHYGRGVVDGWNGCLAAINAEAERNEPT